MVNPSFRYRRISQCISAVVYGEEKKKYQRKKQNDQNFRFENVFCGESHEWPNLADSDYSEKKEYTSQILRGEN
jgi:hypothetical protein